MTTSTPTTKLLAIGTINPGVTGPPHELRTDSYWPAHSASSVAGHESKPLAWQSGRPCASLGPGQKRRMSVTGHFRRIQGRLSASSCPLCLESQREPIFVCLED